MCGRFFGEEEKRRCFVGKKIKCVSDLYSERGRR
jgi:hypothetical protein